LSLFNENIEKIKSANLKTLATEVFVSKASYTIAPYLTEKKLAHQLDSALSFADCVCLDLSRLSDSLALKGMNPAKLQSFLEKIGFTVYKNLALRACYEYEFQQGLRFSAKSVSKKILPISPVLQKGKAAVLLRIRDDFEDKFLENMLLAVKKSQVIDAIIVDYNIHISKSNSNSDFENSESNCFDGKENCEFQKMNNNWEERVENQRLKKIRNILGDEFPIVSCGAVYTGLDAFFRLKSGADFLLVDSAFLKRGPYCLEKILKELEQVMEINNITSIKQIRASNKKI